MKDTTDFSIIYHVNEHYKELCETLRNVKSLDDFLLNVERRKAILFDFFQIGELLNQLSLDFREKFNNKYFVFVVAIRNKIVHGYEKLDDEIILKTLKNDIPSFIEDLNSFTQSYYQKYIRSMIGHKVNIRKMKDQPIKYQNQQAYIGEVDSIRKYDSYLQKCLIIGLKNQERFGTGTVISIIEDTNSESILIVKCDQ